MIYLRKFFALNNKHSFSFVINKKAPCKFAEGFLLMLILPL